MNRHLIAAAVFSIASFGAVAQTAATSVGATVQTPGVPLGAAAQTGATAATGVGATTQTTTGGALGTAAQTATGAGAAAKTTTGAAIGTAAQTATGAAASVGTAAQTTGATTVKRETNQQTRVEQGLQGNAQSGSEAGRPEKEQSRVDRPQSRPLKDGKLSAEAAARGEARVSGDSQVGVGEQHRAQQGEKSQSRHILRQKHDGQVKVQAQ